MEYSEALVQLGSALLQTKPEEYWESILSSHVDVITIRGGLLKDKLKDHYLNSAYCQALNHFDELLKTISAKTIPSSTLSYLRSVCSKVQKFLQDVLESCRPHTGSDRASVADDFNDVSRKSTNLMEALKFLALSLESEVAMETVSSASSASLQSSLPQELQPPPLKIAAHGGDGSTSGATTPGLATPFGDLQLGTPVDLGGEQVFAIQATI